MKPKTIKVLFLEPKKEPKEMTILDTLDEYRRLIGGYMETVTLSCFDPRFKGTNIIAVVDEEGVLKNKEPNISLRNGQTILVGNIVFVSTKKDRFVSLTDEEIKKIKEVL